MNKPKLLLLLPLLFLGGCHEHKVKMHHDTVKLEQLKPDSHVAGDRHAAYAYQDPSGIWWYYWMLNTSSSTTSSASTPSSSYGYSTASGSRVPFPAGGTWSRSTTGPAKQDIEEENEQEVTIDETEQGPATQAQEAEAAQNGGEVTESESSTGTAPATVEPAPEAPAEAAPAAEPATEAPADSGGTDAGGGGDGGGGGGE